MSDEKSLTVCDKNLLELQVTNLGVIERTSVLFGPGMTVITGETGAGKTLIVTALQLLTGQRAESSVVGPFGKEAKVEARYLLGEEETIITRIVPKEGRSRAYIDGAMATVTALAEVTSALIEIHGQHGHTALGTAKEQRNALDAYGLIDLSELTELRMKEKKLHQELLEVTGNSSDNTDLDYLQFQEKEIADAGIENVEEEERLKEVEKLLADATGNQLAALRISEGLSTGGRIVEELSTLIHELKNREALSDLEERINEVLESMALISTESRNVAELIDTSPERLVEVQERRSQLTDLRRKYGETIEAVLAKQQELQERIKVIEGAEERAENIRMEIEKISDELKKEETKIAKARKKAAPKISKEIETFLQQLSLPNANVEFSVEGAAGEDVQLLVSLNRGQALQPIQKAASGGELSRTMLALRLVLSAEPATIVFDEVDAGIGGGTAHSIGSSLKKLASERQILVVTHLAQVAASADTQIRVTKTDGNQRVGIEVEILDDEQRVVEISRMLSGSPDSENARKHAKELLEGFVE